MVGEVGTMSDKIAIDESKCTGCLLCSKVCFINYEASDNGKVRTLPSPMVCAACGHCVAVCPTGAISHPRVPTSDCEALDEANRLTYDQLMGFPQDATLAQGVQGPGGPARSDRPAAGSRCASSEWDQ